MLTRRHFLKLLAFDAACLYFSFLWVAVLRRWQSADIGFMIEHLVFFACLAPFWLWVFHLCGLYDPRYYKRLPRPALTVGVSSAFVLTALFLYFVSGVFAMPTPKTALILSAALAWVLLDYGRPRLFPKTESAGAAPSPFYLVIERERLINESRDGFHHALRSAALSGTPVFVDATLAALTAGKVPLDSLGAEWIIEKILGRQQAQAGYRVFKRVMDLIVSAVILAPAFVAGLLAAAWVKLFLAGPLFYSQQRIGRSGKPFRLWKFRTMREDKKWPPGETFTETDDPRVPQPLRWIRRFHLDELPQIVNILKGEMSWVGPRPEQPAVTNDLEAKIPYYWSRHVGTPGLTGWAQINRGYADSFEQAKDRFSYDLYYLANQSLYLDAAILFRTLRNLITADGR